MQHQNLISRFHEEFFHFYTVVNVIRPTRLICLVPNTKLKTKTLTIKIWPSYKCMHFSCHYFIYSQKDRSQKFELDNSEHQIFNGPPFPVHQQINNTTTTILHSCVHEINLLNAISLGSFTNSSKVLVLYDIRILQRFGLGFFIWTLYIGLLKSFYYPLVMVKIFVRIST